MYGRRSRNTCVLCTGQSVRLEIAKDNTDSHSLLLAVLPGHTMKQYGHSNSLASKSSAGGGGIETRSPPFSSAKMRKVFVDTIEATSSSNFTCA